MTENRCITGCGRLAVSDFTEKPTKLCSDCWRGMSLRERQSWWLKTNYGLNQVGDETCQA